MRVDSAFHSGVTGFQRAEQSAELAGSQLSCLGSSDTDRRWVTDALIALTLCERPAAASVRVVQSASAILGTLIDIRV